MYTDQKLDVTLSPEAQSVANGTFGAKAIGLHPQQVTELWATITTAISTATVTLTFQYRPVAGVAANQVTLGTLVLPITVAVAGRQYFKRIAPFKCNPGGDICVVASGTGAGNATVGYGGSPNWDAPGNNAQQFASA